MERDIFSGKKAVIFDWDGTLADSVGVWDAADRELIAEIAGSERAAGTDFHALREEWLRANGGGADTYLRYCAFLGERFGRAESAERLYARRRRLADRYLREKVDYKEGAEVLLRMLKRRGFLLAVASGTLRENMEIYRRENKNILAKAPPDDYFSVILTREDAPEMKPSPEIYLRAVSMLGVSAGECLAFEDSLSGVEAAKGAGIRTVAVENGYSDGERKETEAVADVCISGFPEAVALLSRSEPSFRG